MAEILCPVRRAAEKFGEMPGIVSSGLVLSWREVDREVGRRAGYFESRKISAGSRVALAETNSVELVLVLLAVMRLKATAVLLNPRFPKKRLVEQADNCGCSCQVRCRPAGITLTDDVIQVGGAVDFGGGCEGSILSSDQPVTLMYTSGSAGEPRAVVLTLGNHWSNAEGSNEHTPVEPGDRWLLSLPLFHVAGTGIMFRCLVGGAALVLPEAGEELADAVKQYSPTHLSLVATQLQRLLVDETITPPPNLKVVLVGGGPIAESLIGRARDLGWPALATYGMTETASQIATGCNDHPTRLQLLPRREIKIDDTGEILVRGEVVSPGVWDDGRLESFVDDEGWFHTGDTGSHESVHGLKVSGRLDQMFISGGENIQPGLIERALVGIEGINEAVVVPVEDTEFGYRPVAFVRCDDSVSLSECESGRSEEEKFGFDFASLVDKLAARLPKYMIPLWFYPWPQSYIQPGIKPDRGFFKDLAAKLRRHHAD